MIHYSELQRVCGPVSRETFDDLERFAALFSKWNARINLVAASTARDIWHRHILDSAQLWTLRSCDSWVDLGSGGGFPGLILAILMKGQPGSEIELIESNSKKSAFLKAIISQLTLPASVRTGRIETVLLQLSTPRIVTARALAPLSKLIDLAAPILTQGGRGLFHKGRDYRREIAECRDRWSFEVIEHASQIESQSVILDISDLQPR